MTAILDCDSHLFESRTTWGDYIDPTMRDAALAIEDDNLGWPWLTWRGKRLYPIESQVPGEPALIGQERTRRAEGLPPVERYDDLVPAHYTDPAARAARVEEWGLDASVVFPNFGLLWEEMLSSDRPALLANLRAANRWMADSVAAGKGRLLGVGHVSLVDLDWLDDELATLASTGIRLAMTAPAPVDGKRLSHPDLERAWASFCEHDVAPVFHVGGFPSPFDPAWYESDPEAGDRLLDSVFLWAAPAIALSDLILNGTFERHPDLRIGVIELSAGWVPMFLLNIDGANDFYVLRHGPMYPLKDRPSQYFLRHVRVAALAYERPDRLIRHLGDNTFMFGSDWPHSEGIADPVGDYERHVGDRLTDTARAQLFGGNLEWLLGRNRQ